MRRRHFLSLSAESVGGLLIYSLQRTPLRAQSQSGTIRVPLKFFTEKQALLLAAAAARIFPSDDTGPGANEAGVVLYIDRQLASAYGRDRFRYTAEPFLDGPPELGHQGPLTPRQIYSEGLAQLEGIDTLSPEDADAKLRSIERTPFFSLLRQHTIEGMFCDPMHGGNIDKIGWQLIGFPGPRMSYFSEVDSYYGKPFRPKPESLSEILGRPVTPSEDEEPA